jgi:uncharacterized protein
MPDANDQIKQFLAGSPHAVVGASRDRSKFGNKVLRTYLQNNRPVYAVNPNEQTIEGVKAYPTLKDLPEPVHGISIITPPPVTERIIDQAIALGIRNLWLQPGAESTAAIDRARAADANIIAGGPCILVTLGFPK